MGSDGSDGSNSPPDVDWQDLKAPWHVSVAGAALGALGLLSLGTAVERTLVYLPQSGWWLLLLVPMLLQALLTALMAPMIVKARAWAAIFGLMVCATTAISLTLWVAFTGLSAYLRVPVLVTITALVAWFVLLIVPFSIPACLRISRARRTLYKT